MRNEPRGLPRRPVPRAGRHASLRNWTAGPWQKLELLNPNQLGKHLGLRTRAHKKANDWTWAEVADKLGHATAYCACLGQTSVTAETGSVLLDLALDGVELLAGVRHRGWLATAAPTDPPSPDSTSLSRSMTRLGRRKSMRRPAQGITRAIDLGQDDAAPAESKGDRERVTAPGKLLPCRRH